MAETSVPQMMMTSNLHRARRLIPVFLLGLALGGWAGWQAARRSEPASAGSRGPRDADPGSIHHDGGMVSRSATPDVKFAPSGDPVGDFHRIQRMRDAALRARAFRQLLASMSPAAIAQLMQTLNRYGEDQEQEDQAGGLIALMAAQQLVIEHAALTDPAAVLTALSSAGPAMRNSEFYQDVLRGWAERDPAAACRFFEQNTLHDATVDAKAVAGALVRELVKTDPEGTFRWLRGLKADFVDAVAHDALQTLSHYDGVTAGRLLVENSDLNKAPELAAAMTEGWARTEPDKALAWALTLPSNISGEGVKTASGVWAAKDYAGAMAAVAALEGGPRAAALSGIAAATGAQHWQELMPMMASLPESADRAAAVGSLIGYWVDKAPDAASQWLSGQAAGPSRDQGTIVLALKTMDQDPESALEWAATVSAPDLRNQGVDGLLDAWLKKDPKAARTWVQQSTRLSEEDRSRLLEKTGR